MMAVSILQPTSLFEMVVARVAFRPAERAAAARPAAPARGTSPSATLDLSKSRAYDAALEILGAYKLTGDLTIRGTTRSVTLDVEETGGGKDPWGNARLGFSAKGSLSRSDFGLTWNQALEAGGVLVSDKVDVDIEVQIVVGK